MSDEIPAPDTKPSGDDFLARILDQLLDLVQTARDWVRQEAEAVVRDKIVPPLQQLGIAVASAWAAAVLLVLGLIFVVVAAIVFLCELVGVPLAFLIIGLALLIGAGVFTGMKVKAMQK